MFPLRKILEYAMTKSEEVDKAYFQFFGNLPFSELETEWEELFHEWLIFDYRLANGATFLVEYLLKYGKELDGKTRNQFQQIAETHHYGDFEIHSLARGKWLILEDIFTGKLYKVYEKKGSEILPEKGTVPGRVAKVDGKWYLVGANSVYFPITHTDRMKKNMRSLNLIKFTPKDTVDLLRKHLEKTPEIPRALTKKEIKVKRNKIQKRYEKYMEMYGGSLLFDDLLKEVYSENTKRVIDFFQNLQRKGLPEEVFVRHINILQDVWNFFPHRTLNDHSPAEMFEKLKGSSKNKRRK